MVVQTEQQASLIDGALEERIYGDMPALPTLVPVFKEVSELIATLDGLEPVVARVLIGFREETHE